MLRMEPIVIHTDPAQIGGEIEMESSNILGDPNLEEEEKPVAYSFLCRIITLM